MFRGLQIKNLFVFYLGVRGRLQPSMWSAAALWTLLQVHVSRGAGLPPEVQVQGALHPVC